jgi:type IV secretory pathway VirB9-like protein
LVQPQRPQVPLSQAPKEKPTDAEKVYPYTAGASYAVPVAIGRPFDIVLEPGEQVRNIVGGGGEHCDKEHAPAPPPPPPQPALAQGEVRATVPSEPPVNISPPRWEVCEGAEGHGETQRAHVFLAVSVAGRTIDLILTTTQRTYYATAQSVKTSPVRVLRWTYPISPTESALRPKEPGILPDPMATVRYHVGYQLASTQGHPPDWMPRSVVDDGKKLYILYPEVILFETVPVVRMIGPNGPQLVNARQFLNVVIVDMLPPRLELRVGIRDNAEVVTITREKLRTIECPGESACPVWPSAAQTLAEKGSQP